METSKHTGLVAGTLSFAAMALSPLWWPPVLVSLALYLHVNNLYAARLGVLKAAWLTAALLAASLAIAKLINGGFDSLSVIHAMALSFAFPLHAYIRRAVPARKFGILQIPVFWFAIQYLFIKIFPGPGLVVLADLAALPSPYFGWSAATGLLGISAWIWLVNLLGYGVIVQAGVARAAMALVAVLALALPFVTGTTGPSLQLADLVLLYTSGQSNHEAYIINGELIARTAAWISILIVIFTVVRFSTQKK